MKYKTIIFDLDGTLLDTLEDLKNSVNYTMDKKGYPLRTLDEVRNFVGNGVKILLTRSLPLHVSEEIIEECLSIFREHYMVHMYDHTKLYDGIHEMLVELSASGCDLAIVSNKLDDAVQELKKKFMNQEIQFAVGTPPEAKKPDPFCIFKVMEQLNAESESVIYVGDSDVDIATAANACIPCIGVSWGFCGRSFLEQHHADYVIDSPSDLLPLLKNIKK